MAQTVQQWYNVITANLVTEFSSVGITIDPTKWSKRNVLRLMCYTIAIVQSLAEQLQDVYISRMEEIQRVSSPATIPWLHDAVFKFQYSVSNPQYLSIIGGVIQYAIVNPAYRIITACAVSSTITNYVNVKVAKGSPLVPLSAPELTALQDYVTLKGAAGITYIVSSSISDKIYLEGSIYYQGIYSAVIQNNVITAINNYLSNLSKSRFGGDILMSDIEILVRSIEGVNDVTFERVSLRLDSQALFGGIDLVIAGDWINRKYTSGAGYIIEETTVLNTFADKLTFIPE